MVRPLTALGIALGVASGSVSALDRVLLKDNAALTGRILLEKEDQVVVDVGYTVLNVPRSAVLALERDTDGNTAAPSPGTPAEPATAAPGPDGALFRAGAAGRAEKSVRELVSEVGEAVVQVRAPSGLGSGFFLNDEGYLITNFHVIEGETQISVEVYHQKSGQLERRSYKQVRIVAMNKFRDLALLRIEDPGAPRFASVPLGETDGLAVGERVFAVGSPLGLERTVTEGIISTKTRQMQGDLYLQTTAQINPGNSGGPLFNLRGEVIGVTNMKINAGEGLGFAIPVEEVRDFLRRRDAFAFDLDNPSSGYRYLEPPSRLQHGDRSPQP